MIEHVPDWAAFLVAAAATLTAVSYIWQRWIRPIARIVREAAANMDTLHAIASEFHPNHGTSLRDTIDRIETTVDGVADTTVNRTALFADLQATMETTQEVLQDHMADDQASFAAAHQALAQGQQMLMDRLSRMEATLDLVQRHTPKRSTDE